VRAAICRAYGDPDVVRVEDVPAPASIDGHVRVRVRAAAVNHPDILLIANNYQVSVPVPFVPGSEFAGVSERGERVFGSCLYGAFAEEVVVPATSLRRVPDGVGDRHAAAFGVAHRTAYSVLRSVAAVQPGETVIVLGAGGGVGLATVQLAAVLGASVTAVASSAAKLEAASAAGARHLIDHRAGPLRDALRAALPDGADVVVDPVGGDLSEPALRTLHYGGRFITVGYASGVIPRIPLNLVLLKGVEVRGFQMIDFVTHAPSELARNDQELRALLADGRALPHICAAFAFDEVVAALRYVAEGNAIGKVVLDVAA
jgi:NADPH2:quinone reductase